jgi:hypothetical protein
MLYAPRTGSELVNILDVAGCAQKTNENKRESSAIAASLLRGNDA